MRSKTIIGKIDIWLVIIYLALATIGLLSIYAAAFNEAHPHIWDFSQNYGCAPSARRLPSSVEWTPSHSSWLTMASCSPSYIWS